MYHILVVDDNKANLAMAKQELSVEYQVTPVISGAQALQFLEKKTPSLIMLDLMMPEMDGRETMKRIREREEWTKIPIVFLTADSSPETESEILRLGADDFVAKPFVPEVMKSRIRRIIELNELRNDLETRLAQKSAELEQLSINAIMAISGAIEAKDEYTRGHSARVAECSVALAKKLGWSEEECENLRYIALLHDIGKIGVPDSVLNKPARLTDEEFSIIKKHPVTGGEILKGIRTLPHVDEGALYHHERYDGRGYPNGLKGEDIPLCARIIGIADSYDAMTSNRVYRKRQSTDYVISEFERCSGSQFDPELAAAFVEMLKDGFTLYGDETEGANFFSVGENSGGVDLLTGLFSPETTKLRINELITCGKKGALLLFSPDN
ncbi:MAG: response regulator, partial [Ruminococcaceae bacterium]|nr:response regulator [Oscillospiraceae bacterium]